MYKMMMLTAVLVFINVLLLMIGSFSLGEILHFNKKNKIAWILMLLSYSAVIFQSIIFAFGCIEK